MPRNANDTTAAAAAPVETAHHPYCLCGTHGSYKMIAGLLIGLFLLASAFVSGVIAGKISDRLGSHQGRAGMMGGYGQKTCPGGDVNGYGRGGMMDGYRQEMGRGYHGYGYERGTTTAPALPDASDSTTTAPAAPTTPAQ